VKHTASENPHSNLPPEDKPSDSEAYHKGPPPKQCPPEPFDISKCPSVQAVTENQPTDDDDSVTDLTSPRKRKDRPLISYAYSESDFARINLQFFITHALHSAADFIFILNGDTDVDETILPKGRTNIRVIKRENTCFDLGAHAEVLSAPGKNGRPAPKDKYKRFILMNASIRGPFVPHWSRECWSDAYLGRLNSKVKLVGATLNCHGGNSPHVQSMIWATDSIGLQHILSPSAIGECFDSLDAAMGGEVRTTGYLREQGYEVDVMLSIFQTERDYGFVNCKDPNDFLYQGSYFGFSVHPYETLFIKSHRGIEDNMLEKLSVWSDMSGYTSEDVCKL
jgi:hypothetical protein